MTTIEKGSVVLVTTTEQYLRALHADLDVEIDLHGGRTDMARNIRLAIIATELELQELGAA